MSDSRVNQALGSIVDILPDEILREFKSVLQNTIDYTPKIGVMGKSGAGKSSLINAIIGQRLCETGGVGGCTRAFQEERLKVSDNREIIFMDLPGVAENSSRHDEYQKLYASKIADLDVILWVIKVDDRANKNDEEFYQDLIKYYKKERILFVLSQCDKAEPSRDWDYTNYKPSDRQLAIIDANRSRIMKDFDVPPSRVIPVACEHYDGKFDRYNLELLVKAIVQSVPDQAKSSLIGRVAPENISSETKKDAQDGFAKYLSAALDTVIDYAPIPTPLKSVARKAKDYVVDVVSSAWNYFFG